MRMTDSNPLREYLRAELERQIDHAIAHDEDPELRALLILQRERVVAMLLDQAELIALRRTVEGQQGAAIVPLKQRANGAGSGRRTFPA
jgi:hypothetical protein